MKETIALIDDDRNILTSISIALEKEGFNVQTYLDGESALIGLSRTPPDLAIIDIKMPKMDGEELLKKLRKKTSLPVIFLTSKDDEIDELLGLKLGADDFVKKSGGFSIKILIERIRVQLRKKNINIEDSKNIIVHGKLKLEKLYTQTLEGFLQLGIISQEEFNNVCKDRKRKSVGLDPSTFNPLATTHGLLKIQTQRTSMEDFRKLRTKILGDTNDT